MVNDASFKSSGSIMTKKHAIIVLPKRGLGATAFMIVLMVVLLSSCGKRPAHIDPPSEVESNSFPRVYPDPATDP